MQQRLKCVWDRWMNEIYSCPPIHKTLHLLFLLSEMSSFLSAYPMPNIPPSSLLSQASLSPWPGCTPLYPPAEAPGGAVGVCLTEASGVDMQ